MLPPWSPETGSDGSGWEIPGREGLGTGRELSNLGTAGRSSRGVWGATRGYGGNYNCTVSQDCASGYSCSWTGECVKIDSIDDASESLAGDNASPTTVGGCETGGSGGTGSGGGISSPCGAVSGGGGCAKPSCSSTGSDGGDADNCCGSRCCRSNGTGVDCFCGTCPDTGGSDGGDGGDGGGSGDGGDGGGGKACSPFCDDYKASTGLSYGGTCSTLECTECSACSSSGRCTSIDGPCHCSESSCGGCEKCNRSSGQCEEEAFSTCETCLDGEPFVCPSGETVPAMRGCGASTAAASTALATNQANACANADSGDCQVMTYSVPEGGSPPPCPSNKTCANFGFIRNEETGETDYLREECPESDSENEDVPELPGGPGSPWNEGDEWQGSSDLCGISYDCQPGQICGLLAGPCIDDPTYPGDAASCLDGVLCGDGLCCTGTCFQPENTGGFGCCRGGDVVPIYRNTIKQANGTESTLDSVGGPTSVSLADICLYGCGWGGSSDTAECGFGNRFFRPLVTYTDIKQGSTCEARDINSAFVDCYCRTEDCGLPSVANSELIGYCCIPKD